MTSISALINGISSSLSADGSTGTGVNIAMLKKAMATDSQNVQQLLASVAPAATPPTTNNPPHLGNNVDTTA